MRIYLDSQFHYSLDFLEDIIHMYCSCLIYELPLHRYLMLWRRFFEHYQYSCTYTEVMQNFFAEDAFIVHLWPA